MRWETETTLMLSETSLTTQTSSLLRGLTETGSRPTGISASNRGLEGWVTSNTDNRPSGVLTANNREPSGESRTGLVCLPSKFTYALWAQSEAEKRKGRISNSRNLNTLLSGTLGGHFRWPVFKTSFTGRGIWAHF